MRRKNKVKPTDVDSAELEINGVKVKIMGPATRWAIVALTVVYFLNQ